MGPPPKNTPEYEEYKRKQNKRKQGERDVIKKDKLEVKLKPYLQKYRMMGCNCRWPGQL